MEPIGLAIGVAGLTGVFTSCVDGFNYFSDGKTYHEDSEVQISRLEIVELRFLAWGSSVGLQASNVPDAAVDADPKIKRALENMKKLLVRARDKGEKYIEESTTPATESASKAHKGSLALRQAFKKLNPARKVASVQKGFAWGVHDGPKLKALIGDLVDLLDSLEKVCEDMVRDEVGVWPKSGRQVLQGQIAEIADADALQGIQEAAKGVDLFTEKAARRQEGVISGKDEYSGLKFTGKAKTQAGPIVYEETTYNRDATYKNITADGDSQTHLGGVYGVPKGAQPGNMFSSPVFRD